MARGINEVKSVHLAISGPILQRRRLGLDGDAPLALEIHGVEHLLLHLTIGESSTDLDDPVGQGALSMVDMGNDGKVSNILQIDNTRFSEAKSLTRLRFYNNPGRRTVPMHQQSHRALSVEAFDQASKLGDGGHRGPVHGQDYVTLTDSCPFG